MKLFSAKQVAVTFNQKVSRDVEQVAYLETELTKLQKRINTENNNFETRLVELRKIYGEAKENLQKEIQDLEKVVKRLQEERTSLLIPITGLKEKAEALLQEREKLLEKTLKKEELVESQLEVLHNKIDELSTRESILEESEQKHLIRKESTEKEAEQVSEGHRKLNALLKNFKREYEIKTKELRENQKAVAIKESRLQEMLIAHKEQVEKDNRILKDKRETLERAFNRLNKK